MIGNFKLLFFLFFLPELIKTIPEATTSQTERIERMWEPFLWNLLSEFNCAPIDAHGFKIQGERMQCFFLKLWVGSPRCCKKIMVVYSFLCFIAILLTKFFENFPGGDLLWLSTLAFCVLCSSHYRLFA